jgi:hypothetical protein
MLCISTSPVLTSCRWHPLSSNVRRHKDALPLASDRVLDNPVMLNIKNIVLTLVLRRVVSRACASTIQRSGRDGEAVNCFNTIVFKNGKRELVLQKIEGDQVEGLRYDGDNVATNFCIPLSDIDPSTLQVTHYYGLDTVNYEGAWSVARGLGLGWPYAWLRFYRLWNSIAQTVFNRRSLPARRRLDFLREVFEASTRGTGEVDAMDLMTSRHGSRWAEHPSWQSHQEHMDSQLELLADVGDLSKSGTGYRPTGQGLKTLEEAEEADRRHKDNFRIQVGLGVLAFASALMAAAQAGVVRFPLLLDLTFPAKAEVAAGAPLPCVCSSLQPTAIAQTPAAAASSAPVTVPPAVKCIPARPKLAGAQ